MPRYLLIPLFALVCSTAGAEIYRWVDDKGAVHYGERPPAGAETTRLQLPTEPTGAGVPDKQRKIDRDRLLESYERDRLARQRARDERRQQTEARASACKAYQSRWRLYSSAGPLYDVNEDGSRRYLSAAEKDAELARLRAGMQENCDELPAELSRGGRR